MKQLGLRDYIAVLGSIPLRDFFRAIRNSLVVWVILSLALGALYVLALFVGDPVRQVSNLIPGWLFWLALLLLVALVWRDLWNSIKELFRMHVSIGGLLVSIAIFIALGLILKAVGDFSGWLGAWLAVTLVSLYFLVLLLAMEIDRRIPFDVDDSHLPEPWAADAPLDASALKKYLKRFLDAANRIEPEYESSRYNWRCYERQAENMQAQIVNLVEDMRTACAKAISSLKDELLNTNKPLDPYHALEQAEERVANARLLPLS